MSYSFFKDPEWRSGLRHCISVLEASLQTMARFKATSRDWESHRAAHNWPSVDRVRVWPG